MSDNPEKKPEAPVQNERKPVEQRPAQAQQAPQMQQQPRMSSLGSDIGDLIDEWFADHFPGSAVARHTDAWNHVMRAKDDLKQRLASHR